MEQIEQNHCAVDSFFGRLLETLNVEDEVKHNIHNFLASNMDWNRVCEPERMVYELNILISFFSIISCHITRERLWGRRVIDPVLSSSLLSSRIWTSSGLVTLILRDRLKGTICGKGLQ
jgi:hypothetical protein